MNIVVAGGSGFIGSRLVRGLAAKGHQVSIISRSERTIPGIHCYTWAELEKTPALLEGAEGIVNLTGESINQRWTKAAKGRILHSRLAAAGAIARIVHRLEAKPRVVVNSSGIAIYGESDTSIFTEKSPPAGNVDFLTDVTRRWEEAARSIGAPRIVVLRTGLVLDLEGGAFPRMAMPYRLFAGGRVGNGNQWYSWIHVDDLLRLIEFCLENPALEGPVNATSPEPEKADRFGRAIGRALHRPHWMPVPAFMLKLLLGEMSELVLTGQRVLPHKAQEHGFHFQYPSLDSALAQMKR